MSGAEGRTRAWGTGRHFWLVATAAGPGGLPAGRGGRGVLPAWRVDGRGCMELELHENRNTCPRLAPLVDEIGSKSSISDPYSTPHVGITPLASEPRARFLPD
jgi:hypothetical protein